MNWAGLFGALAAKAGRKGYRLDESGAVMKEGEAADLVGLAFDLLEPEGSEIEPVDLGDAQPQPRKRINPETGELE